MNSMRLHIPKTVLLVILFFTPFLTAFGQIKAVVSAPVITLGSEHPFYGLQDVAVRGGYVVVLTGQDKNAIKVFKKDRFITSFGRSGPGPFEFQGASSLCITDGRITVLDFQMGSNKLVIFDLKGDRIKEIPLRGIQFAGGLDCFKSQKVLISTEFMGNESKIFWVNKKKNILKYSTDEASIDLHPSQGPMNTQRVTLPFRPKTKWDLIGKNKMAVWDGSGNKIYIINFRQDTLGFVKVSNLHIPVTEKDIKEWINSKYPTGQTLFGHQNFYRGVREALFEYDGYAEYFPLIKGIQSSGRGGLWLYRGTKQNRQIWTLQRENQEPVTVKFPPDRKVYSFGKKWIAAAFETDDGIQKVELYKYEEVIN